MPGERGCVPNRVPRPVDQLSDPVLKKDVNDVWHVYSVRYDHTTEGKRYELFCTGLIGSVLEFENKATGHTAYVCEHCFRKSLR